MKRFFFLLTLSLSIISAAIVVRPDVAESAGKYPSKPVKVIIPWGAGGGTDILMRGMLTVMSSYFPQPMVIINKPGGGGTIGTTQALKAKPDGYTILVTGIGPMVTQPFLKKLQYTEKDYIPVVQLSSIPRIITAHPSTPYDNMKDMMSYAKANPNKIKCAVAAIGTTGHLGMAQLEIDHGVKITMIPQGGGGPQKVSVLGGHTDIAPLPASTATPLLESKQVKAICVMADKPLTDEGLSDIPICADSGYPVESGISWHTYVPAGTPSDRVKVLHDAFKGALEDKVFLQIAKKLNVGAEYKSGEASAKDINKLFDLYKRITEKLGIKM